VEVVQLDLFAPSDLHCDRQRSAQARFWEPTIMDYEQEVKLMIKSRIGLLAALALTACASTGPHQSFDSAQDNDLAHLVITRPSVMYATETARVSVDGIPTCSLMPHGDCEVNIPAGPVAVSVSMPLAFGVSTLSWQAIQGQTYQVVLRHRGVTAIAVGGFLGAFVGPFGAADRRFGVAMIIEDMKLAAVQLQLNHRRRLPMTLDDMGALADRILVWAEMLEGQAHDVGLVGAMVSLDQHAESQASAR
jgi:hypothetical protein